MSPPALFGGEDSRLVKDGKAMLEPSRNSTVRTKEDTRLVDFVHID
jgi:hypothetical protein